MERKISKKKISLATRILFDLDASHMPFIKAEWEAASGGVNINMFVRILRKYLPRGQDDDELETTLAMLFNEMDLNGDSTIEWDEFTSYIVDSTMSDDVNSVSSERLRQYRRSAVQDSNRHDSSIEHVRYFKGLERVVCCEQRKKVKVYGLDGTVYKTFEAHAGAVLCSEYIPDSGLLVTSGSDLTLAVWDATSNFNSRARIATDYPLTSLMYSSQYRVLCCGTTAGHIHLWRVTDQGLRVDDDERQILLGHTDIVSGFAPLEQLDSLVSASIDSSLRMWDMTTGQCTRVMRGHGKGVVSVAYSAPMHVLLSAGFEHEAYIWTPFVGSLINKLVGHNAPLIGVEVLNDGFQVVTADIAGYIKVWDLRRSACLQTLEAVEAGVEFTSMTTCAQPPMLMIGTTKKMLFFDTELLADPTMTDEHLIVGAVYNNVHRTFLTAAGRGVKLWDARTGLLSKRFPNIMNSDVTAFALDDAGRRMLIGDHAGAIKICNCITGGTIADIPNAHKAEITAVCFMHDDHQILSGGWDYVIRIFDITDPREPQLLKEIQGHKGDITALAVARRSNVFASGGGDGQVRLWDSVNGQMVFSHDFHPREINAVVFLDPLPVFAVADSLGYITLFTTPPTPYGFHKLVSYQNFWRGSTAVPVVSMAWAPDEGWLYTGDERGEVKIWHLGYVFRNAFLADGGRKPPPRRLQRHSTMTVPMYLRQYGPQVGVSDVKLVHKFKAHDESITMLQLCTKPHALVTASADRLVRVWTRRGVHLGSLRTLPETERQWHFDDAEAARDVKAAAVLKLDQERLAVPEGVPSSNTKVPGAVVSKSRRRQAACTPCLLSVVMRFVKSASAFRDLTAVDPNTPPALVSSEDAVTALMNTSARLVEIFTGLFQEATTSSVDPSASPDASRPPSELPPARSPLPPLPVSPGTTSAVSPVGAVTTPVALRPTRSAASRSGDDATAGSGSAAPFDRSTESESSGPPSEVASERRKSSLEAPVDTPVSIPVPAAGAGWLRSTSPTVDSVVSRLQGSLGGEVRQHERTAVIADAAQRLRHVRLVSTLAGGEDAATVAEAVREIYGPKSPSKDRFSMVRPRYMDARKGSPTPPPRSKSAFTDREQYLSSHMVTKQRQLLAKLTSAFADADTPLSPRFFQAEPGRRTPSSPL